MSVSPTPEPEAPIRTIDGIDSEEDHALAHALVAMFERELPRRLSDLNRAVASGDLDSAARIADRARGSAAVLGAVRLAATFLAVARAAREARLDRLAVNLEVLAEEYPSTVLALRRFYQL
ncbi:MAG: Hpt domain-containing protein [Kofleriaceae bacterium]